MSTHKNIDRICIIAIVICLMLTAVLMNGEVLGITQTAHAMGYENRLFDTDKVHTIDIVMDDWDSFIASAQSEEYYDCTVVIDGEAYSNVGIRGKGNTSLSNVSSMDSERYSFKVEFDQYDGNRSYHGLDKLSLNNIIQDNTYMKDYLTYRMMNEFGVSAPLCSFAYITVNGDDWGLYLAVEGVEDSFLQRNYGNSYGELYKPDSMSFGGGRGNGRDFDMNDFMNESDSESDNNTAEKTDNRGSKMQGGFEQFSPSDMFGDMSDPEAFIESLPDEIKQQLPDGFSTADITAEDGSVDMQKVMEIAGGMNTSDMFGGGMPDMGGGFGGGMGSDDVKLNYTDDNFDSYSNIFNNAKTDVTDADKERLIASLKALSGYENLEEAVDIEMVIRYFVVHNFVCNGDSYTGSMIHNYYLYEENGKLSMIPWDYNLAYGTFQSGDAAGQVNSPIDTPVSGDMSDRPMIGWIFSNDEYTQMYHEYFSEFLAEVDITGIIDSARELIDSYVEKDPTKFCTYEEFEKGVETLRTFCLLRSESVSGQLNGSIPSTSEGQSEDSSSLVDASGLTLSDMGTMSMGGKGGFGGGADMDGFGGRGQRQTTQESTDTATQGNINTAMQAGIMQTANMVPVDNSGNMPQGGMGDMGDMQGMQPPEGFEGGMPGFGNMEMPTDENGNPEMPEGFGGGMPDFENPAGQGEGVQSEAATGETQQTTDTSDTPAAPQNSAGGNGEMHGFDNMQLPQGSGTAQSNTLSYILLGVSALLLAGGLIFAFKFKR